MTARLTRGIFHAVVIGILLGLWQLPVRAGEVVHLHEVAVPVADRSAGARAEAMHEAMSQVLVRVTGEREAARLVGVETLLQQPGRYVQQFRYVSSARPAASGEEAEQLLLRVRFDGAAIERALRDHGLPIWGRERPAILLWLAVGGDQRRLIADDSAHPLRRAAEDVAQARGLPILLPVLDLQDQASVGYADVWGGFDETVLAASRRYQPQVIMLGRLQRGAGGWQGRWTLHFGQDVMNWTSPGVSATEVLKAGLNEAADRLALRLAVRALGSTGEVQRIRVRNVFTLDDYARTLNYLEGLTSVRSVQVLAAEADSLDLLLALDGDVQTLGRLLSVGRVLDSINDTPEPVYRLIPR